MARRRGYCACDWPLFQLLRYPCLFGGPWFPLSALLRVSPGLAQYRRVTVCIGESLHGSEEQWKCFNLTIVLGSRGEKFPELSRTNLDAVDTRAPCFRRPTRSGEEISCDLERCITSP